MCRFYGRIAEKADNHDEATLNTIKDNIEGLQKISGERIWGELQKILRGNFATELFQTMLRCQMGKYIGKIVCNLMTGWRQYERYLIVIKKCIPGLPATCNYEEIDRLHTVMHGTFQGIAFHPVTVLASQLNEGIDATHLQTRLKMSAYERDLGIYLATHKNDNLDDLL